LLGFIREDGTMRAFLAIDLADQTRARLSGAIEALRSETVRVRWVVPSQIHVTLKFFADLTPDRQTQLASVVSGVAGRTIPFTYAVRGLGFFASGDRMRVIWCGIHDASGSIATLQRRIEDGLAPLGFAREERPFKPHLTLGRLKVPSREPQLLNALKGMATFEAGVERLNHIVLFSSRLTPEGPIYTVQARFPLGARP
jgi:2'-5' RNA ligase